MMCDALRRLRFASVESYQYVGMGSVYFSDFALFHKALGVTKMVSIERQVADRDRFEFNRPFANIEMLWGPTSTQLPVVDFSLRSIVWLDYDQTLSVDMLNDVAYVVNNAPSGSVLIVSVQCEPPKFDPTEPSKYVSDMRRDLGRSRVDPNLKDSDLIGDGLSALCHKIVLEQIDATLTARNGVLPEVQRVDFAQVFHFSYADGAQMLTVGGVLFDRGQRGLFSSCTFEDLPFVRTGSDAFKIGIPKLTLRELRSLEEQLPLKPPQVLNCGHIPSGDAEKFAKIYRYFPNFVPIDIV